VADNMSKDEWEAMGVIHHSTTENVEVTDV